MKIWIDDKIPPPNGWTPLLDYSSFESLFKHNESAYIATSAGSNEHVVTHISFSKDNAGKGKTEQWILAKWLFNAVENNTVNVIPTMSIHGEDGLPLGPRQKNHAKLIQQYIDRIKEISAIRLDVYRRK